MSKLQPNLRFYVSRKLNHGEQYYRDFFGQKYKRKNYEPWA